MKKLFLILLISIFLSFELSGGDTKCDNQGVKCGNVLLKQPGVSYFDTLKSNDPQRQFKGSSVRAKIPGFKQSDVLKFTDPSRQLQGTDVPTKQPGIKYSDTLRGIIRSDQRERDVGGVLKIEKKKTNSSNSNNSSEKSNNAEAIVRVDNPTIIINGTVYKGPGVRVGRILVKPNKESRKILRELQMNLKLINYFFDSGKCCGLERSYQENKQMMNIRGLYDNVTSKNIYTYLEARNLRLDDFKNGPIKYDIEKVLAVVKKDIQENGITDTFYLIDN